MDGLDSLVVMMLTYFYAAAFSLCKTSMFMEADKGTSIK